MGWFTRKNKEERPREVKGEFFYGGDNTIHDTGHVDVVLDETGQVVAVWFRCAMLPFEQSPRIKSGREAEDTRMASLGANKIKGIVFEDEGD